MNYKLYRLLVIVLCLSLCFTGCATKAGTETPAENAFQPEHTEHGATATLPNDIPTSTPALTPAIPSNPTGPSVPTATHSAIVSPTPSPADTPTSPTPSAGPKTLLEELADALALIPTTPPVSEEFLQWMEKQYDISLLQLRDELAKGTYTEAFWYGQTGNSIFVLSDLYTGKAHFGDNIHFLSAGNLSGKNNTTTVTFGGDICFADNYVVMQSMKNAPNGITDCIDPKLIAEMSSADIAFMNNEFTISHRGSPLPGKKFTFRAAPEHTALYQTLGIDIVSLANNHAFDYGADAFSDTLDALKQYNIAKIGGGKDLKDAAKPVYYIVNGRKIAFVAATRAEKYILTPAATKNSAGVLRCYDTKLFIQTIQEAKRNSDYVIACIHWGTEHTFKLEDVQRKTAKAYIDAGADLIIGAHAHQLQGIEYYKGKAIFYNLGNFWFDNYDIETGLVKLELASDGSTRLTFLPAWQKDCVTTWEVGTEKGRKVLNNMRRYSIQVDIDENGVVTPAK